jgi:hypothetical protein
MENKSRSIAFGAAIGAAIGAAMAGVTHQPGVWLPLGIGIGLAIGVAIRDRKNCDQLRTKN